MWRDGNFACGIHPATQSVIGEQQWVVLAMGSTSNGSLGFIVCEQCCRMVDSVPIRHLYPVANTVRPSVDAGEMITPA